MVSLDYPLIILLLSTPRWLFFNFAFSKEHLSFNIPEADLHLTIFFQSLLTCYLFYLFYFYLQVILDLVEGKMLQDNYLWRFLNLYSEDWSLILKKSLILLAVISCNSLIRLLYLFFRMLSLIIYDLILCFEFLLIFWMNYRLLAEARSLFLYIRYRLST